MELQEVRLVGRDHSGRETYVSLPVVFRNIRRASRGRSWDKGPESVEFLVPVCDASSSRSPK